MTDAGLLQMAAALPQLTQLSLAESAHLTAEGIAAAAARMPALADLDLTACQGARDDQLLDLLGAAGSPGAGALTPATIQLPQGGTSPTGSPFRRRSGGA